MTLLLIIIGAVCLIVGYMVPTPPPVAIILRVVGAICLVVGLILLVAGLLGMATLNVGTG